MQLLNAAMPILSTLSGMIMLSSEVQFLNAELPILSAPSGIVTLVKEQPSNAELPIFFNPLPNLTFDNLLQLKKAKFDILFTLSGIDMLSSEVQFANA